MLIELSIGCFSPLGLVLRPMLSAIFAARFSKTARSGPGHREAGWGDHDVGPLSVVARIQADDVSKSAAEGAEAGEPHVQADVGDAALGLAQQEHRSLDPPSLEIAMRRLSKGRAERPDEVRLGDPGHTGKSPYVQGPRIGAVDRVTGTQHAAVQLLDGAG